MPTNAARRQDSPEESPQARPQDRIETLIASIDACPDPTFRAAARELAMAFMDFHGIALRRFLAVMGELGGPGLVSRLSKDPDVRPCLVLHGIHPSDLPTRVREALEEARPALHAARADVELVGIENGQVRVRITGAPPSAFLSLIQNAIDEYAPEVERIDFLGEE